MGLLVEGWGERERKKNEKLITLEARTKRESFGASLKKDTARLEVRCFKGVVMSVDLG